VNDLWQASPISRLFERVFHLLSFLPPQIFLRWMVGGRDRITREQWESREFTIKRARNVEYFIAACALLDVAAFVSTSSPASITRAVAVAWACLRVIDILQATVNVTLFDELRERTDRRVTATVRLVILAFVNYLELIICFATIYASALQNLAGAKSQWDAAYFSVVTQLTIGYGDITPRGSLRAVVAFQAIASLAFVGLVFVRALAALPQIRETLGPGSENPKR